MSLLSPPTQPHSLQQSLLEQPPDTSEFPLTSMRLPTSHMHDLPCGPLWIYAAPGPPLVTPFQPMRANLLL